MKGAVGNWASRVVLIMETWTVVGEGGMIMFIVDVGVFGVDILVSVDVGCIYRVIPNWCQGCREFWLFMFLCAPHLCKYLRGFS